MEQWAHWQSYGHVLAKRLRYLRLARGLSQARLAELAGLSRNLISNLERNENTRRAPGDPLLSTIYRLATVLDVPPVALLPGAGDMVQQVCTDPGFEVDVEWPGKGKKLRPFAPEYIALAKPGDRPIYADSADETDNGI